MIDLDRRNRVIEAHGAPFIERRRRAEEPSVVFDLEALARITGRDMTPLCLAAHDAGLRSRFLSLTDEQIARELLRLETEDRPTDVADARTPLQLEFSTKGIKKLVWSSESPLDPKPAPAAVTLEEFFDGNDDPGSFAPDQPAKDRPRLDDFRAALAALRDRDDVVDLRVVIDWWPDPDEPKEDARWMRSNMVCVWTRDVKQHRVREWFWPLGATRTTNCHGRPFVTGGPATKVGMRIYRVTWGARRRGGSGAGRTPRHGA
ncbi:MAG: hypothetical protein D6693_08060 [Planctomycetota bacterium]|nr:MAG: hypothetical protein D6693_08060 [Planctomycetota bacterium]